MRRTALAVGLALVLVSATLVPVTAAAQFDGLAQQSVDADVIVMDADVAASGDAQWTLAYRIRLTDDSETQAFEDLRADIESNTSAYTDRFRERMGRTVTTASDATGREMAIRNLTVETSQESFGQSYGVVTYRFRWTNFAAADGNRIEAGHALSGLFLDADTSLTLRWPAEYTAESVTPEPDERSEQSATWRGQQSFGSDEPRVTLTSGGGGPDTLLLGVLAVGVALVAAGVYAARRRLVFGGGDSATAADAAGAAAAGDDGAASTPPEDLLSNEEQLLRLLRENGGRIKQQRIAEELEWTDAKTSQVVGGLREDDEVETFRIGRENVVTLPDTDLTDQSEGDV
jgi:hypothetical protein